MNKNNDDIYQQLIQIKIVTRVVIRNLMSSNKSKDQKTVIFSTTLPDINCNKNKWNFADV